MLIALAVTDFQCIAAKRVFIALYGLILGLLDDLEITIHSNGC